MWVGGLVGKWFFCFLLWVGGRLGGALSTCFGARLDFVVVEGEEMACFCR